MATLERVAEMKQRGMTEQQISRALREEGFSPREISDAISQSKIKGAIDFNHNAESEEYPEIDKPVRDMATRQGTMKQSIMTSEESQQKYPELESPAYQEELSPEQPVLPEDYQEYYPEQSYQEYQPQQSIDIETMNEIAEQISEEKNQKLIKEISSFSGFKDEISSEIKRLNERLQKIENLFDDLQIAILKKIGNYGEDLKDISREMHLTQESFSKILDPLTENVKELQKITNSGQEKDLEKNTARKSGEEKLNPRKIKTKKRSADDDFMNYLR